MLFALLLVFTSVAAQISTSSRISIASPQPLPNDTKLDPAAQPHPVPYSRIIPENVDFSGAPDTVKLHNRSLNDYGIGLLAPNGKIRAMQWFMKKKNLPVLYWDVERYLEILAYAHELMEWGPSGPPGGFSITNLPKKIRKKRGLDETEAQLYVSQIQPVVESFGKWLEGATTRQKKETKGEIVTLFDEEAEKTFLKEYLKGNDYLEAIGNYILVPKDTDLGWLQGLFREMSNQERHKRQHLDKLRKLADKFRTNKL